MSVTTVFRRLDENALRSWLSDPESFDEKNHPGCQSIELGVELMAVADLAGRARNLQVLTKIVSGTFGSLVNDDRRLMSVENVSNANVVISTILPNDIRAVYDLERLQADLDEIEDWTWDEWGPDPLESVLIPSFERIKSFFREAAGQKQSIAVYSY